MKKIERPMRHVDSARNRKKALHHAKCLLDQIEFIDRDLRRIVNEDIQYALGRVYRLVNRLRAEVKRE